MSSILDFVSVDDMLDNMAEEFPQGIATVRGEISKLRADLASEKQYRPMDAGAFKAEIAQLRADLARVQQERDDLARQAEQAAEVNRELDEQLARVTAEREHDVDIANALAADWHSRYEQAAATLARVTVERDTLSDAAEKASRFCRNAGWYIPDGILTHALRSLVAPATASQEPKPQEPSR